MWLGTEGPRVDLIQGPRIQGIPGIGLDSIPANTRCSRSVSASIPQSDYSFAGMNRGRGEGRLSGLSVLGFHLKTGSQLTPERLSNVAWSSLMISTHCTSACDRSAFRNALVLVRDGGSVQGGGVGV